MTMYETSKKIDGAARLSLVMVLCAGFSLTWPDTALAQDDGAAWLQRIDAAERVPHSYGVMRQTITTSGGSLRTFTVRSWSAQNGDVSLMAYDEPARVAGDKILMLDGGDNIWYYMRRRDVTRHFAGHTRNQSAMGSDFSYEDLAQGDLTGDFTAELRGDEDLDGTMCVKLLAVPTPSGPSYDSLYIWASVDDQISRRIEYFENDENIKTLFLTDLRIVDNRKTAFKMEMVNHREGSRTLLETVEVTFTDEPDPSLFTRAALTRRIR